MKILVCGGRYYNDADTLFYILDELHGEKKVTCVVQGGAGGADTLACIWANNLRIKNITVPAEWDSYGNSAGPIRNKKMLDENPDIELVVAFPGNTGTADMVSQAKARNIPIKKVLRS